MATPSSPNPKDVVLLCNPLAGGRWRALAEVFDSPEAHGVRRIVTDEIGDVAEALAGVGRRARLICIYGGDGTIYHLINALLRRQSTPAGPDGQADASPPGSPPPDRADRGRLPILALLGGGTMNVTGQKCGMSGSVADNFRSVMRAYLADHLRWRDVPVLSICADGQCSYGFTFGMGPMVRLLDKYEHGRKGKIAALGVGARAIAACLSPVPTPFDDLLRELDAAVTIDGERLPYRRYSAVFANTTGTINRMVEPFSHELTEGTFHSLAYAVKPREVAARVPLLARGVLPLHLRELLDPRQQLHRMLSSGRDGEGGRRLPRDPRYVNRPARELRVVPEETLYTVDGEVLRFPGGAEEVVVRLGPSLPLALRDE
jgi:hypothetical protein